jgi:hypothetical protein
VSLAGRRSARVSRRHNGNPAVLWVCEHVEPLLHDLVNDPVTVLMVWNAVSDPREVLDLHRTVRWSATRPHYDAIIWGVCGATSCVSWPHDQVCIPNSAIKARSSSGEGGSERCHNSCRPAK